MRYASGEESRVGDYVECVLAHPVDGTMLLGNRFTVQTIEPDERTFDRVGFIGFKQSEARAEWSPARFRLIRRAEKASNP